MLPATPGAQDGTVVPFSYYGQASVTVGGLYIVAGDPGSSQQPQDVLATDADLVGPSGVVVDPSGNVVISDASTSAAPPVVVTMRSSSSRSRRRPHTMSSRATGPRERLHS